MGCRQQLYVGAFLLLIYISSTGFDPERGTVDPDTRHRGAVKGGGGAGGEGQPNSGLRSRAESVQPSGAKRGH